MSLPKNNNSFSMSPVKLFFVAFGSFMAIATVFIALLSLTGAVFFLPALGWTALGLAIFVLLIELFQYIIIDSWWDNLEHKTQSRLRNIGIWIFLILFFTFPLWIMASSEEGGYGQVNLFTGDSKNYRVKAVIERSNKATILPLIFGENDYRIKSVEWSNDVELYFSDCTVRKDERPTCVDDKGDNYKVELEWFESDKDN